MLPFSVDQLARRSANGGQSMGETPLEQAERHVLQCESAIERIMVLIDRLESDGRRDEASDARVLLGVLQESLRLARQHLDYERLK